ncbi:MAG: hypothetical protein V2L15_09925 [Desulfobacteraceae bacterium]|jgi:hypothetical protein|nr:hypothetical protein [Desulfobacteraceae bacterium]
MDTQKKTKFTVFIPEARVISEGEKAALPKEKQDAVAGKAGLWVEVRCPEGACSQKGDKITLPGGVAPAEKPRGIWLNLFCPDNQCLIRQYTDLP